MKTVFAGYRGSFVYGLHNGGDFDKFKVFVAPKSNYIGLGSIKVSDHTISGLIDETTMELRHFCSLLVKQSPTVLEWLYTPDYFLSTFKPITPQLSKKLYAPFIGFASKPCVTPKDLSHKVRLLTMCREALETGELIVERPDADYLMGIKLGEYIPDTEPLLSACEDAFKVTKLPENIDTDLLSRECEDIILAYW